MKSGEDSAIFSFTDRVADYMVAKFRATISAQKEQINPPEDWSPDFLAECETIVHMLAEAFRNTSAPPIRFVRPEPDIISPVNLEWDVERYCDNLSKHQDGLNDKLEQNLQQKYKPLFSPSVLLNKPAVIADKHGNVLVWYLPSVLHLSRQVCMSQHRNLHP